MVLNIFGRSLTLNSLIEVCSSAAFRVVDTPPCSSVYMLHLAFLREGKSDFTSTCGPSSIIHLARRKMMLALCREHYRLNPERPHRHAVQHVPCRNTNRPSPSEGFRATVLCWCVTLRAKVTTQKYDTICPKSGKTCFALAQKPRRSTCVLHLHPDSRLRSLKIAHMSRNGGHVVK